MESAVMGKVMVLARIENVYDLHEERIKIGNPAHGGEHVIELY